MKLVILNYCGTVGKTTLSTHLFQPRMQAKIIAVESINMSAADFDVDVDLIKGNRFREIYQRILVEDDLIIDVGASNIENFLANMVQYESSHEEIDYFIIPVTSGEKEQRESMNTAIFLLELGIDPSKVKFIFNKVDDDIDALFPKIIAASAKKKININKELFIPQTELFNELIIAKTSLTKIINDDTDYKKLIKETDNPKDKAKYANLIALKSLSKSIHKHLDYVFSQLF